MTTENPRTELEKEMMRRVRRHMLTSLAGVGLGIVLAGLGAAVISALASGGQKAPPVSAVLPLLGIAAIPVVGFWSTFRNLRCPSCNSLVISQVSWNFSLFSAAASKSCASCAKKIFPDDLASRFRRVILIVMAVSMGLGFLGAVASGMATKDAKERRGGKLLANCVGLASEADCSSRCSDEACLTACRAELKECDALRSQVR